MSDNFQKYSQQLVEALEDKGQTPKGNYDGFDTFVKGDVSGIQRYIFNVRSEGASKTLKARSLFIQAISSICVNSIQRELEPENVQLLYNGGGNFYLFIKSSVKHKLGNVQKKIAEQLRTEEFYISISTCKMTADELADFGKVWERIQNDANEDKLRRFTYIEDNDRKHLNELFEPYHKDVEIDQDQFKKFTSNLVRSQGHNLDSSSAKKVSVSADKIEAFGSAYVLENSNVSVSTHSYEDKVLNKLPIWTQELFDEKQALIEELSKRLSDEQHTVRVGNIIEFESLALFAKERTGTSKLGVLKMDIDNLGLRFNGLANIQSTQNLSQSLKWFFEEYIYTLLQQPYGDGKYEDNIYVVFSGGDDCFMLGAWDAVFEFSLLINEQFKAFAQNDPALTLSAGLLLVDSKFPVIRFADLAEEAIKKAKTKSDPDGKITKNKVCIFGEALTWNDFKKVKEVKDKLVILIKEKGESRAVLDRIKQSAIGYKSLQKSIERNFLSHRKVWRFIYYLRNVKKDNRAWVEKELIQLYEKYLITTISTNEKVNEMIFPIAARWTEFLTRKK